MKGSIVGGGVYRACEWIAFLAYVNVLWLLFSLLGCILFGFMPATAAMFFCIRKYRFETKDFPVWATFWQVFRREYRSAQKVGGILGALGGGLFLIHGYVLPALAGEWAGHLYVYGMEAGIVLCIVLALQYLFPMLAHVEMGMGAYFKNAALLFLIRPLHALGTACGLLLIGSILLRYPSLFPFYGGSIAAMWLSWNYERIEQSIRSMETMEGTTNHIVKNGG
ncbi:YesL family protein [Aneurinibacillus sp. REN35]|uniref:YesL family protein n=1 Tax=Aneurinibacillus sp. REN35 TaxID=3237286 RepID=UPI00352775AF